MFHLIEQVCQLGYRLKGELLEEVIGDSIRTGSFVRQFLDQPLKAEWVDGLKNASLLDGIFSQLSEAPDVTWFIDRHPYGTPLHPTDSVWPEDVLGEGGPGKVVAMGCLSVEDFERALSDPWNVLEPARFCTLLNWPRLAQCGLGVLVP